MCKNDDRSLRHDMIGDVKSILEESSFEDKCRVVGVAPHDSGMGVNTAAGVGGAMVPVSVPAGHAAAPWVDHGVGCRLTVGSRRISPQVESSDEL